MQDSKTKRKALDEGNCGIARSRGKEAVVKAAGPRTGTGYEAGDWDEWASYHEVLLSESAVKPGVVSRKSPPLPRETCPPYSRQTGPGGGNTGGERTGVSSGHSSAGNEPGVRDGLSFRKDPEGLTHARRTKPKVSAETAASSQLVLPLGEPSGADVTAEKDCGQSELWDRILEPANLNEAWRRVRANGGAAGIDRMSIAAFPAFVRAHWNRVCEKLQAGTYAPSPVRRVYIPKKSGGQRPLGIPTVLDRVIQQAIAQVLGDVFEPEFSEHSYAYRPGRNGHDALRAVRDAAAAGDTVAVDCDLKSFFDHVDHDRLMVRVAARVRDHRVLRLIGRYLRAGVVLPDGTREPTPRGVPQGGPLSPLLANIMLTPLDRELERRGLRFARYADDFLILVPSRREAVQVMAEVVRFVEGTLKLTVNPAKSRVAPLADCVFLGCRISAKQIRWSAEAVAEFREHVRVLTRRTWSVSMEQRLGRLHRYVTGWFGYFRISRTWGEVLALDQWLRRRVRQCYWKQWKTTAMRRRMLLRLGVSPLQVHLAAADGRGCWSAVTNSVVQLALSNQWLSAQGVPNLQAQWLAYHYPPTSAT